MSGKARDLFEFGLGFASQAVLSPNPSKVLLILFLCAKVALNNFRFLDRNLTYSYYIHKRLGL